MSVLWVKGRILENPVVGCKTSVSVKRWCLSRRELGNSLSSLTDGVLGKLSGEHKTNGRLDLARAQGGLLVVGGELSGLSSNALEDIVDEGVHDGHTLLADSGVRVDLLEDLVDVGRVGLDALLGSLLLVAGGFLGCLGRGLFGGCLGHGCKRFGCSC